MYIFVVTFINIYSFNERKEKYILKDFYNEEEAYLHLINKVFHEEKVINECIGCIELLQFKRF